MYIYYPGNRFPSLSVTGKFCTLHCKHCNGKYLEHMIPVETPEKLLKFVKDKEKSINGFLLSGGSMPNGKVPLRRFKDAVRWITENTDLLLNVHTGIIDRDDINYLEEMNPHHISFDVVGSTETIKKVLGLNRSKEDYFYALEMLDDSSLNYSPHIIIGLNFGRVEWEYATVDFIANLKRFSNLVLIVLIPTKGTPMEKVEIREEDAIDVLRYAAKKIHPGKIVLGCMRPRKFVNLEREAVDLNFKGIVIPSLKTMRYIRDKGIEVAPMETCCVFP